MMWAILLAYIFPGLLSLLPTVGASMINKYCQLWSSISNAAIVSDALYVPQDDDINAAEAAKQGAFGRLRLLKEPFFPSTLRVVG